MTKKENNKNYYRKNKEYFKSYKKIHKKTINEYQKKYRQTHKTTEKEQRRKNEFNKKYLKENINARIKNNLRSRIRLSLRGKTKSKHTLELLGCSIDFFKEYLKNKFLKGMTFENYGKGGWDIDHIIACSNFNLTDIEQQKQCFHYSNLQPLWHIPNIAKGNKLTQTQLKITI